jgi:hypothetical protein
LAFRLLNIKGLKGIKLSVFSRPKLAFIKFHLSVQPIELAKL